MYVDELNTLCNLLSFGSQLKCILEPVKQFVGKLTDILKTNTRHWFWVKVKISCVVVRVKDS